jgi:hypothetical protein
MEEGNILKYKTFFDSYFQVNYVESDAGIEISQVNNMNALSAESNYADVGTKQTKNGCLICTK